MSRFYGHMNSKIPRPKEVKGDGKHVRFILTSGGFIDADASSVDEDNGAIYGTTQDGMNFVLPINNLLYATECV